MVNILDSTQVAHKIERIAYQIYEDNVAEKEIVVAGILDNGYIIAQRLRDILEKIAPFKVQLIQLSINRTSTTLEAHCDIPIETCTNKTVVLVDDVLNSGRTLAYGFGVFLNIPLKKLRTVVLVDRKHHSFPISVDYSGLEISTILQEHITVQLHPEDHSQDRVYLS